MKAVEHFYYTGDTFIHSDVEEITEKGNANREFRCRCCGRSWIESINSPQILEEEVSKNLSKYYPRHKSCATLI